MNIGEFLAVLAALCHIAAYLDYNRKVFEGKTKPNGATWLIWASLAGLNASSYLVMSSDLVKGIFPIINTALCISTFVLALGLKKFEWPDNWDLLAMVTGLVAAFIWWEYHSATSANLILQLAIFFGFIPTYRLIWRKPSAEQPRPWWIWVGAYVFLTATVVCRWQGQWQDLAYPANCFILHYLVPKIISARSRWIREKGGVRMSEVLSPNFDKRPIVVYTKEGVEKVLRGLISVVTQDYRTGEILMVAYTDQAGYQETLRTGKAVYYSTSRRERWLKGETSGDIQLVRQILIDCDGDAIIYLVEQMGEGSCHTSARSCFYRDVVTGQFLESPKAGPKDELVSVSEKVHETFFA